LFIPLVFYHDFGVGCEEVQFIFAADVIVGCTSSIKAVWMSLKFSHLQPGTPG